MLIIIFIFYLDLSVRLEPPHLPPFQLFLLIPIKMHPNNKYHSYILRVSIGWELFVIARLFVIRVAYAFPHSHALNTL